MNGRLKQAVVGVLMFSSVSAVGASVTLSQLQGAARIRRAVRTEPKAAAPVAVRVASETAEKNEALSTVAAERLTEREVSSLSRVARTHRVQLSNGSITGAIQAIGPAGVVRNLTDIRVSFFQNGGMVTQVAPAADGVFNASLAPGVYTLVAYGPNGYAAYGVQIVDPTAAIRSAGFETASAESQLNLQIETLAVPPVDYATVYRLARTHVGSVPGPVPTRADSANDVLPDLPAENALPQTNIKHHTVRLEADGSLLGRLKRIHPQTGDVLRVHSLNAFLVQNGTVVHQTSVAEDGALKFSTVAPGTYSFVTAGSEGFSAFSVIVAPAIATAAEGTLIPVSFQAGDSPLTGTPGAPADTGPATDPLAPAGDDGEVLPPAGEVPGGAGGGGFGGGSGGGAGGGAGGGGLGIGGLLGLAGVGLGAAALLDDDDDNNGPVSPAGP